MSFGFEIKDASGNLALSLVHRLCRSHSFYSVGISPQATVNISIPGLINDNTWAAYLFLMGDTSTDGVNANLVISPGNLAVTSVETPATGARTFYIAVVRY